MFDIFKKESLETVSGEVERIGAMGGVEYELTYVLKLKDNPKIFILHVFARSDRKEEIALTKENDEVVFMCDKKNNILGKSFNNMTFPTQ